MSILSTEEFFPFFGGRTSQFCVEPGFESLRVQFDVEREHSQALSHSVNRPSLTLALGEHQSRVTPSSISENRLFALRRRVGGARPARHAASIRRCEVGGEDCADLRSRPKCVDIEGPGLEREHPVDGMRCSAAGIELRRAGGRKRRIASRPGRAHGRTGRRCRPAKTGGRSPRRARRRGAARGPGAS